MKKAPGITVLLGLTLFATARFTPVPGAARRPAAVTAVETWTIPGAGRTAGQNNTQFVSDLALTNLGTATANVTISFVGPGGLPAKPITIAAGATTVYRNVLDALWSATGLVGALSVQSDQPLVLRARTYNTAATGTFGVALPVYSSAQLLAEGQTADSLWVQQDPSSTSGFRTNVGVVFPDAGGGDAVVTFYDAAGSAVGTLNYSSPSAGFQQQSVASIAPAGLPIGRAQISVTRGHAAGYAVGVDNVTGDTSLYPLEALPAGVQDVVVNGVARLNGRNNTFFRTDARLYNPTSNDVTVTARFHAAGQSNPTPQSATTTVPAGRIIQIVDLLGSVLNAPVGSGGAVRFTADQPVAILCRTSNVDPQGAQPGTFGAQQKPVPLASFLSSADAGAVVTAIRQDASFRTNVGFTAGPDGATYGMTLKSAAGSTIAGAVGTLGAFGWTQASIADLFPGTAVPADATLLVNVASGTVDVYDASLDNASGDLVVTPIAPVPAALSSSASIGPTGGSIRSADGRLTLKVPAGAISAPVTFAISSTANTAPQAIGSAYQLTPVGVPFTRPAQIVLAYADADLAGTGAGALGIASQDGSSWYGIEGGSVDPVARTLTVPVSATSPGPAPARAGRVLQRAAAPNGHLGPYGSVMLIPDQGAVPLGGTKHLGLGYVGPSSTQHTAAGFALLATGGVVANLDTDWYVNGVLLGNRRDGTILSTPTNSADYTAPDCPPSINPVRIAVEVKLHIAGVSTFVQGRIRVIEKNWRIETTYTSFSPCTGGPAPAPAYSFGFTRSHDGTFELNPQGQVVDFLIGLTRNNQTDASSWCIDSPCSRPSLSTVADLTVHDVTGRLVGDTLSPFFDLTIQASVPGTGAFVSFTCGTGTFQLPIVHGAPAEATQPVTVRYPSLSTTLEFILPSTTDRVRVVLTPIRPNSCP